MFKIELTSSILSQNVVILSAWEGRFSENQQMEDDPDTEQIASTAILYLSVL